MKTIVRFFIVCLSTSFLLSCDDEFMDRFPLDQINDNNFWTSEQDLALYCNDFYPNYISGFGGSGFGDAFPEPFVGYQATIIPYGDVMSDNASPNTYLRIPANEYIAYISGGSGSGKWNFSHIRRLNYFLENYQRVNIPAAKRNVYLGEILFFKAWDYYEKVKLFGDVPWYSKVVNIGSPELTAKRTPRAEVMDSILYTIDKAIEYLPAKGSEKTDRLNKKVALHLKARICLFEGTYRKYHKDLGLDGQKFLNEAVLACEILMSGDNSLYTTGNINSDYNSLFAKYEYRTNSEIILWKEYSEAKTLGVAFSRYFTQNLRFQSGATRSLVDEYLCTDGMPISESPLFMGYNSVALEMQNRDPRLRQTICNFGEYTLSPAAKSMGNANNPLPAIRGLSGNKCPTGFRVAKWYINDATDWGRVTLGMQACPIFRYAEILLTYAEAKYELGQCTQTVIDKTVNLTRARVGMPGLTIGNIPNDPKMDGNYSTYCGYVPEPLLREIRRERRIEFAFENFRWDDLMRWKAGRFLEIPVEGIKFDQATFPKVVINKDVFLSANGFILPYFQTLPAGRKFDESKQYLFPIPVEDLILNPNLTQNPGWQGAN
ncbi:MAG: RagB/SusD family nutrient uptake outer membrane protein [Bacteroidales bacterium]|nr:MAG: RagB/SusD family nutrient uptake outer membrane protein [Bacteroidales bacterium]